MPNGKQLEYVNHSAMRKRAGAVTLLRNHFEIEPLDNIVRAHVKTAWKNTSHDVELSARLLGIGRTTMYRYLKKFNMDRFT